RWLPHAAPTNRRNGASPSISWRCAQMRPPIWRPLSQPVVIAAPGCSMPNSPRISWATILLLNGTHEETGKRIIAGHVKIERDVFLDSLRDAFARGWRRYPRDPGPAG